MQYLDAISKMTEWSLHFHGKPFNITVIQVYAPNNNAEEAEQFYEDLLELTPPQNVLFIIGGWNAKAGSQETPGVTGKFGLGVQNEAGQRTIGFCQENTWVIANAFFQQDKRRLYTWTSPDGQHWNLIDCILCSQRWRSPIQSAKKRPGADCGSDHELLTAKLRLKLKKAGKTTRLFRYDLNQIPYDYTVEVRNRLKGLDLIDRVLDEVWTEILDTVQETGNKAIPKEKKCKKSKCLSEEALKMAVKREVKSKGEKKRYTHMNAEFQRISREIRKLSSVINAKK